MASQISIRRGDEERQKNILRLRRRPGTTDQASSKRTTHCKHAYVPCDGSLHLPEHRVWGKSDAALWVDVRKERDFSVSAVQPITLQTSLVLRNTALRRKRTRQSHCHSRACQLPLISFQRPSLGLGHPLNYSPDRAGSHKDQSIHFF